MSNELIPLPTYGELVSEKEIYAAEDKLSKLLMMPAHNSWIKMRDDIKVKDSAGRMVALQYMPIDKVEYLLTKIFPRWRVEVVDFKVLGHSVGVHVRLHYRNPVTNEWLFTDGLGGVVMQFDSKSDKNDINNMKSNAIQLALPAAKSYAIKDAAETLGTIFGKDLNRRDVLVGFSGSYTNNSTVATATGSTETTAPAESSSPVDDLPL